MVDESSWIQTVSGRAFPILHPTPEDIDIKDIAHALSNLCRFAGHTDEFYSVAQHSVLVSRNVPAIHAMQALLHDAPEAYIVDLPRPLKHSGMVDGYRVVEDRVWAAVAQKFYVFEELDPSVKLADQRALFTEHRDLMGTPPKPWKDHVEPFPQTIKPLSSRQAKKLFLKRYVELEEQRVKQLMNMSTLTTKE